MVTAHTNVYTLGSPVGEFINTFLTELNSTATATAYRGDFNRFCKTNFGKSYNLVTNKEIESIDYDMVISYRKSLDLANSTINRHINSLKAIILHLKARKVVDMDIDFLQVIKELPKQTNSIPHMPIEIVQDFIMMAEDETHHGRIKANAIMFAVDSGLRLKELVELKWDSFQKVQDGYLLSNVGKGNKQNKDKIAVEVYEQLKKNSIENDGNFVFFPLSEAVLKNMMVRIRKKLGYTKPHENYSFHSLRKTSITYTHDMTGSLLTAQRKANHSSPNTTTIYIENRELEMTGYFSTQNVDKNLYEKIEHSALLDALADMPTEFLQILNNKIANQ